VDGAAGAGGRPLFPRLRQALTGKGTASSDMGETIVSGEQVPNGTHREVVVNEDGIVSQTAGMGSRVKEGRQAMFGTRPRSVDGPCSSGTTLATSSATPPIPNSTPGMQSTPQQQNKVVAQAAPSNDWRKSWGQPVDHRSLADAAPASDTEVARSVLSRPTETTPARKMDMTALKTTDATPDAVAPPRPPTSVTESPRRTDPLIDPDKFSRNAAAKLVSGIDPDKFSRNAEAKLVSGMAPAGPGFGSPGAPIVQTPFNGKIPLGAQSVVAASDGLGTQFQYLPVPMMTMPDFKRPPSPPPPNLPAAPVPPQYVNAFTPASGGYGPAPMMPPAYAQAPGGMPNPYPVPPGFVPNPYYAMGPGMPPPAMTPGFSPVYRGPMPPNPFAGTPVMPASYMPSAPASSMNPAMDRQGAPTSTGMTSRVANPEMVHQLTATLRDALYPSQRELAANGLTAYDWRSNPTVLSALLTAAREDPAASVRAASVRCLVKMNIPGSQAVSVLQALCSDNDAHVRQEAEQALARLGSTASTGVQPVRAVQ
jgi:hypothetical protein